MSEKLSASPLAESREAKHSAETYTERKKAIADQATRIIGKMIERANASEYGGNASFSFVRSGGAPGTKKRTRIETGNGSTSITHTSLRNESEQGFRVGFVPEHGIDTTHVGRASKGEYSSRSEGPAELHAINEAPKHLAEMRGVIADEEKAREELRKSYDIKKAA